LLYLVVAHLFVVAGTILAVIVFGNVLLQRRSPSGTMAWLLVIVLIPYVGVPLYLILGGRKLRNAAQKKRRLHLAAPTGVIDADHPIEHLLRSLGNPPASSGNRLDLCANGEAAYHALVKLIDDARHTLNITMFILHPDDVGRDIVQRLARRAADGIRVRLLLDSVGSMHTSRKFLAPITDAGGRVAFFMPVLHLPFRGRSNLRNHRKLVVADGRIVLAGGMNIAIEYMGPAALPTRWRDLAFVVEGPAAGSYDEIFRTDWEFACGEKLPAEPDHAAASHEVGNAIVQVVPSGPDVPGDSLYHAIVSTIYAAQQRLWVITPYFIPDDSLMQALALAARRGVDVRIIVPDRSNHPLTDLARAAYLRDLDAVGAKVLRYPLGMVHAKALVADNRLAMIGSANMDPRSLFLDFEVMLVTFTPAETSAAASWIETLAADSLSGVQQASTSRQVFEGLARLAGPLM